MLYGSICLSDIPKRLFKKVQVKDGSEKIFLNVKVVRRKEVGKYGHTHFVSCEPRQDERVEGENYMCGEMKEYAPKSTITPESIDSAPAVDETELPF